MADHTVERSPSSDKRAKRASKQSSYDLLVITWEKALLLISKPAKDEDLARALGELDKSLHDVTRAAQAKFLLKSPLPTVCSFVMDANFTVDLTHKRANEFIRTSLLFCIASVEMDPNKFGKEACQLMSQVLRHRFFQALLTDNKPATPQPTSWNDMGRGRDSLTASRKAKALSRLNQALSLFTQEEGYQTIIAALTDAFVEDLALVYQLVDVVSCLSIYIGKSFLKANLPHLFSLVHEKLLNSVPKATPIDRQYFDSIQAQLKKLAVEYAADQALVALLHGYQLEYTTKLLKEVPTAVSILFLPWPAREKDFHKVDIRKLKVIADVKTALAGVIGIKSSDLVLTTVSNGRITTVHKDSNHVLCLTTAPNETIVAYNIPSHLRTGSLVQVVQTKPVGEQYVPFFLIIPKEKNSVTPKQLYESVGGSYTFALQRLNQAPFALRLFVGDSKHDLVFNATKPSYLLNLIHPSSQSESQAHGELRSQDLESNHIEVEWTPDVVFEELQGYDVDKLSKQAQALNWAHEELAKFVKDAEMAKYVSTISALKKDAAMYKIRDFVRLLCDLFNRTTQHKTQILLAQVLAIIFKQCNGDYFNKILNKQLSVLEARTKECLQSPSSEVRKTVALAICTLASSSAKYNDTPIFDILPYSKPSGEWEEDHNAQSHAHVDVLSPGLQFLFKLNFFRTIDVHYLNEAKDIVELYWYLPFILKTLEEDRMQGDRAAHRRVVHSIVGLLRRNQFLAQYLLWLKETNYTTDKTIEWATSPRFEATQQFFQKLGTAIVEKGMSFENLEILDPIFFSSEGSNIIVKSATVRKIFTSKAKPFLLELTYQPSSTDTDDSPVVTSGATSSLVIFKKGDDLRVDMLVQSLFYMFNTLWKNSGLVNVPFTLQYKIIPMGPETGCVEFVTGSESMQTFDFSSWVTLTREQKLTFITSAAGGYVAGWVLGIRDRHQDNMMVRHGHIFYQIDFGHLFNSKPTIDAPRFAVPHEWKQAMSPEEWDLFKDTCADAFRILHRNAGLVVNFTCLLFDGIPALDLVAIRSFLASSQSLMISVAETEACEKIKQLIESGVSSWKRALKDNLHTMFAGSPRPPPAHSITPSSSGELPVTPK